MKKYLFLFIQIFVLISCTSSFAQTTPDTTALNHSIAAARIQYSKTTGSGSFLYNGTAFVNYWNKIQGDPFFLFDEFRNGYVIYDGVQYADVPLKYDIAHDDLVTKTFTREADLRLVPEKVSGFAVGDRVFVRLTADSSNEHMIHTGFYERLYSGKEHVYGHYEKKVEKSAKAEENISRFKEYDDYYIEKNGVFEHIEGESDLARAFGDQRAEIKKFLNRHENRFKKDPAATIVKTAAFYDGLKK